MSKSRSSSIYILTGVLIIVGILIFAFRERLLSYLSAQVFGTDFGATEMVLDVSAAGNLDIKILDNQAFQTLSNRVLYFDFDKVGKPVLSQAASPNLQAPLWQAVYLGNSHPFPVKEKKEN
ncbi:MAG: hypothetical protein PHG95_03565 [Patescibacteria group bacterium]|nr:hypothetical protein [Patescibacteria group bacterium]